MSNATASMTYQDLFAVLAGRLPEAGGSVDLQPATGSPVEVRAYPFTSENCDVHPEADYQQTDPTLRALIAYYLKQSPYSEEHLFGGLSSGDREIRENYRFAYYVLFPKGGFDEGESRFSRGTLLLHGLNEKEWSKYLPWALRLVELTGRPVLLFPIAFHMNRTPPAWSNPRAMIEVARERKRLFTELSTSTFANAALSHRLQFAPHRFLTSGLQSYYDLRDLLARIVSGDQELFAPEATVDLFGYSAGATLSQTLLMTEGESILSRSRLFIFCGGSILEHSNPISKAIMDAEAHRELFRFLRELSLNPHPFIPWGIGRSLQGSEEFELLRSLILSSNLRELREERMGRVADRIKLVALGKDQVFYPAGVTASWQRRNGTSLLDVEVHDPDYEYSHEQPFPHREGNPEIDRSFREIMEKAAGHLG